MAVTIKQIAEHAGLSVPTVSRILNNDVELFRVETRDRVLKAVAELGYRPNSYRMALRTKRFNTIGLLFTENPLKSCLSCGTQQKLVQRLHERNQHLVIGQSGHGDMSVGANIELALPKMLREWAVDGMLIDTSVATPPALEKLISHSKIPAIWINSRRETDCVYVNEFNGAREGTERLLQMHHKSVMFLDLGDFGNRCGPDRQNGYLAAMKAAGLQARVIKHDPIEKRRRADFMFDWIKSNHSNQFPTAIVCNGTDDAMPLYVAAMRANLSVPKDLSIMTIHDDMDDCLGLRLTRMLIPTADLAVVGLQSLDAKIAEPTIDVAPISLSMIYDEGSTVHAMN